MEPANHSSARNADPPLARPAATTTSAARGNRWRKRALLLYRTADFFTEVILYLTLVLGPWLFASVHREIIWIMNGAGYALGILLIFKCLLRNGAGGGPARWDEHGVDLSDESGEQNAWAAAGRDRMAGISWKSAVRRSWLGRHPARALFLLSAAILAYGVLSAWNARATYLWGQARFEYRDCWMWLPHSYDAPRTWFAFWKYLAWFGIFWAVRDWLQGKTGAEQRGLIEEWRRDGGGTPGSAYVPGRLRRLLWVLCLNGGLLAVVGIAQRFSGTDKLLWLVRPTYTGYDNLFGPFAYRGNAASYFNMIWPLCAGMAWLLARQAGQAMKSGARKINGHFIGLIPAAILMAACPVVASSRGGAIIAGQSLFVVMGIFIAGHRRRWRSSLGIVLCGFLVVQIVGLIGWKQIQPRFGDLLTKGLPGRLQLSAVAAATARDYPLFGSGPDTYPAISQLYLHHPDDEWYAQAHDDWMQTLATFGWVGSALIAAMIVLVFSHGFCGKGIPMPATLVFIGWTSLMGCLVHAKLDFPFQIHSIVTLFVVICAILSTAVRNPVRT